MKQPNLVHIQGILSTHFAAKGNNCQCNYCEMMKNWHQKEYGDPCKRCGYPGRPAAKFDPHGILFCPVCGSDESKNPILGDKVMEVFKHCRELIQYILYQKKENQVKSGRLCKFCSGNNVIRGKT